MDETKNPTIEIPETLEKGPSIVKSPEISVPVKEIKPQVENENTRVGFEEEIQALSNVNSSRVDEKGMIIVEEIASKVSNPSNAEADALLKKITK